MGTAGRLLLPVALPPAGQSTFDGIAPMSQRTIGSGEEWLAARNALLEREKELTRRSDELVVTTSTKR
jgi:hypothetical protein